MIAHKHHGIGQKLLACLLAFVMVFAVLPVLPGTAFVKPALAAPPNSEGNPDYDWDVLRGIVAEQTNSVSGLVAGLLPADMIKDLVKSAVSGMLDLGNIGGLAGDALGGLIGGAVEDYIGISLPGSIDIGDIIDGVLGNDIVNSIITSDFVAAVIDKTIDNLIDALVIEDVIGVVTEGMIDQLTDELWNGGNPSSSTLFGFQTGIWNTNGGWNTINIGIALVARLGGSAFSGDILSYFNNIDFTKIFSIDTILNAVKDAVVDTATEYFELYKAEIIGKVREKIDEYAAGLQEQLKKAIIDELCKIIPELKGCYYMTLAEIQQAVQCFIDARETTLAMKQALCDKIYMLMSIKNYIDCNDIRQCLEKLYAHCKKSCGPKTPDDEYIVSFDANGGVLVDHAETLENVKEDTVIILPEAVREGYIFLGWRDNLEEILWDDGAEYTVYSFVTFTAEWEENKVQFTVNFVTGGGTLVNTGLFSAGNNSYDLDEGTEFLLPSATRSGYRFDGWQDDSEGAAQWAAGAEYVLEGDVTFTARWTYIGGGEEDDDFVPNTNDDDDLIDIDSIEGLIDEYAGTVNITDGGSPLGALTPQDYEIEDDEVALGNLPQTGANAMTFGVFMMILLGMTGAQVTQRRRKRIGG